MNPEVHFQLFFVGAIRTFLVVTVCNNKNLSFFKKSPRNIFITFTIVMGNAHIPFPGLHQIISGLGYSWLSTGSSQGGRQGAGVIM